ncbi:AraC family transcriptional regulator [Vibrio sp. THAF190c]|uniref:AraC family transcriptional regulator n=1 Tax=Vibrio sp. THAF190c TaxID=2587865 RepID=UPI001267E5B4|nr:AraC family transcriptional regulator [Vibrio sp. THAF190c]QFT12928.1 Transposon Tn10 TetD protein [Vibrio sp. THAF190c]
MEEQFKYLLSPHTDGLSAFSAKMTEFSYAKHAHEEYSIGITCTGRQDFFSDGAYHKSNAGNIVFFNPEQVHDGCAGAGLPLEYQMLYIPKPLMVNLMQSVGDFNSNHARLSSSLFHDTGLRQQVFTLMHLMQNPDEYSAIEEEQMLLGVAQSILRVGGGRVEQRSPQTRNDALIKRAKEFIHYNLGRKITVDEIANAACVSKFHFIRMFSEQVGMTPHQYVLISRINKCKMALESGEKAVDMAMELGFSDVSHLNRKFKSIFGITPNQYQRQLFT